MDVAVYEERGSEMMSFIRKKKGIRVYSLFALVLMMLYPDIYMAGKSGGGLFSWFGNGGGTASQAESEAGEEGKAEAGEDQEARLEEQLIRLENRQQSYPLLSEIPEGADPENYRMLLSPDLAGTFYQVETGDTLWGMAQEFYRTGTAWRILAGQYPELLEEGSVLLPGMEFSVPQIRYVRKQEFSQGGFSSLAFSYDIPSDWHFGYPEWEPCLEVYWSQCQEAEVYGHITDSASAAFPFPGYDQEQYQKVIEQIRSCMERTAEHTAGIRFGAPVFSNYVRDDGAELFFYTFRTETEEGQTAFAVAYVDSGTYTAEFIGCCPLAEDNGDAGLRCPIEEITRYMAVSFTELGGEKNFSSLKYLPYTGAEAWDWEKLHNPFAMAAALYGTYGTEEEAELSGEDYELVIVSQEWEELLRKLVRYHFDMSKEEREELENRPLKASDVAWITEIKLTEHPVPGRDDVSVNGLGPNGEYDLADYHLTTARDLSQLPNLRSLTLEIGTISDYEELADCTGLEELSIVSAEPLKDTEWLTKLPRLKSLQLEISMFTHLHALGFTDEDPTTFPPELMPDTDYHEQVSYEKAFFDNLAKCTGLESLNIQHLGAFDSSFLTKLPKLYYFRISGEDSETEIGQERLADYEKHPEHYEGLHCVVIDDRWVVNEE